MRKMGRLVGGFFGLLVLANAPWATAQTIAGSVLQGSPAPGGGTFSSFGSAALDASGTLVFVASISGGSAGEGLFLARKGTIAAVVLQGSPAPGGGTFSSFGSTALDASGTLVFVASISGGSAGEGLFLARKGTIAAVVLQGSPAPGGGTFSSFGSTALDASRTLVFVAGISGGSASEGLFIISDLP